MSLVVILCGGVVGRGVLCKKKKETGRVFQRRGGFLMYVERDGESFCKGFCGISFCFYVKGESMVAERMMEGSFFLRRRLKLIG